MPWRISVSVSIVIAAWFVTGTAAAKTAGVPDPEMSSGSSIVNWADPKLGARYHAGANTRFLGSNDLAALASGRGDGAIFHHGPRGLEEVIVVELPASVPVRCVVFGTAIDDLVRVPTGFDVSLSGDGAPDSFAPSGRCSHIVAANSLVVIEPARRARFVKLTVRDTSGGSRVSWIGVFSDSAEAVREEVGGFDPPDLSDWYREVQTEIERWSAEVGPLGDFDLTFHSGGLEYSSPPPPGEGTVLERFLQEDSHVRRQLEKARSELPIYQAIGVTAMETYVRWNFVETEPNHYDFSVYDALLAEFRGHGMRWVPLLIAGPVYTLPEWYRRSPDYTPLRCLEHGRDNAIASIWDPNLRPQVEGFIKAFAAHYSPDDLQSVMLGISGSFGEDLYPGESSGDWTTNATGDYHSHFGWWAGDRYARQDFRRYLRTRYRSVDGLNAAWGSSLGSFEEVEPVVPDRCPSRRRRLDFMEWYVGSMTDYLEFWLRTARNYLPTARLEISSGGDGRPLFGADFAAVAKLAAKYGAGIRITNEGRDYAQNVAQTRWISTAARFYGAWLGTEPASLQIEAPSIVNRIFNAVTSGASELFCYPSGLGNEDGYASLIANRPFLRRSDPMTPLAYWVPKTHLMAEKGFIDHVWLMASLREVTDFDAVDGTMIADGALRSYRVLLMGNGRIEETEALRDIVEWVREGGVLVRLGDGPLTTVEGSTSYEQALFGEGLAQGPLERSLGKGMVIRIPLDDQRASWRAACEVAARAAGEAGGLPPVRPEGVYASRTSGGILLLNTKPERVTVGYETPAPGRRPIHQTVVVEAEGIGAIPRESTLVAAGSR